MSRMNSAEDSSEHTVLETTLGNESHKELQVNECTTEHHPSLCNRAHTPSDQAMVSDKPASTGSPVQPGLNSHHSNGSSKRKSDRPKPRREIGNYSLISTLGSGSMGKVRLAVHNITNDKLAVKIVPRIAERQRDKKKREKDENREIRTIREASIMLLLHHPYIVSLKEMVVLDQYYYLFMEYVNGGQLLDYIISHGKLKEKHARRFGRQIASALDYCHRNSIVHRDLKIENILISQSGHVKIIDFGLSNLFSPHSQLSTFCGSLYFAAPELLNAKEYTGPEVDVWSFGVVLYVLTCGKVPFDDQNMAALHDKIKRGLVDYPSHLSSDCKRLLSRMLIVNPVQRAKLSEVMVNPWMNKGHDSPIDNFLPERIPLSLPIDMEVVRGMTGFEFGSEADIKAQLEAIITSPEYQDAVRTMMERGAEAQRSNPSSTPSASHHHGFSSGRFGHHGSISRRKSFRLLYDDPQSIPAAYHPLVSIYYLVKERMERERHPPEDLSVQRVSSHTGSLDESSTHPVPIPELTVPETAHALPGVSLFDSDTGADSHARLVGRHTSMGVTYGKRGKTTIQVDEHGQIVAADQQNSFLDSGLGRLFSRPSLNLRSAVHGMNLGDHSGSHTREESTAGRDTSVFRRLSLAMARTSLDQHHRHQPKQHHHTRNPSASTSPATKTSPIPIPSQSDTGGNPEYTHNQTEAHSGNFGQKMSRILSRRSAASTGDSSLSHSPPTLKFQGFDGEGRVVSAKAPAQPLPTEISHNTADLSSEYSHEQVYPSPVGGTPSRKKGMVDDQIKPVFLKGLFSVTTTSTKHPSVIRADLIRVLERIGVKWRESKGRFECVHLPSIDLNRVTAQEDSNAAPLPNSQRWSLSDEEQPNTGGEANTSGEASSPPTAHQTLQLPQDPQLMSGPPIAVPDLVVRFEVYIVKIPWLLGMHGLQFRRVSGDPWQYKNMCSRILAELKL